MRKAQISMEYMIIMALTMAIIISAVYVFFDYARNSGDELVDSRINNIGNQIIEKAESVYGVGKGTYINIDLQYPDEIIEIYTVDYLVAGKPNSELVIITDKDTGVSSNVFFSDINITGSGPISQGKRSLGTIVQGKASIKIESKGGYVLLNAS